MAPILDLVLRAAAASQTISVTPHDSYSSSVGVLGCKVRLTITGEILDFFVLTER